MQLIDLLGFILRFYVVILEILTADLQLFEKGTSVYFIFFALMALQNQFLETEDILNEPDCLFLGLF